MLVLDRKATDRETWIEIRARWPRVPAEAAEIERLGVGSVAQGRVLRIETDSASLGPRHLRELIDPLVEDIRVWDAADAAAILDVFCRPGVTDAEGEMAALALSHAGLAEVRCHAGERYRFKQNVPRETRSVLERLLGNPLIHHFIWHDEPGVSHGNEAGPATEPVCRVSLQDAGDDELAAISRRFSLALDCEEMRAVGAYFRRLGREPTDVELQSIALAWSEHCSHKTFKATIRFENDGMVEMIDGLLAEMLAAPTARLNRPCVRSAFVDNAGVIAFDARHDVAFKVETHNHPSALEPYGGAHTGVGGVIRDVLAVSAEPIANTDVLCFGPPDLPEDAVPSGAFHPARTYRQVVRGIADYGNNMGIPTVGGAVLFDPCYTANPLVFCGTLGLAPRGSHPRAPRTGDLVVLLGGRTGRDGLHGATMSSETLDRETVAASTVQIGAPVTEKLLRDVLPILRDERLYTAITDCGAGGLCSAVGEMAEGLGVEVDLARVPLKYQGLLPWEIWLSEAQERMVLAVPAEHLPRLHAICRAHDLEVSVLGRFGGDGLLRLTYGDLPVAGIHLSLMHGGRPRRTLHARWSPSPEMQYAAGEVRDPGGALLQLLAHPNIASKEEVIRRYDHEVGGATVIKPLTGAGGPSDAAMLRPGRSWRGVVVSHGINPLYGAIDPHAMAMLAVDEALRNLVAVGGSIDRAALLDNFCWGDVDDPDALGALVRAAQGCRDAALAYRVPFISGKDSLRNTSVDGAGKHSIRGTLLISAVGVVPDVRHGVTMDLKRAGSRLYLVGLTRDELGGSHHLLMQGVPGGAVPLARPRETRRVMRGLTRAIRRGLCLSCHDLSEGGLAVAAAEMALAGRLGVDIDLQGIPSDTDAMEALLFGESAGRFLVEVATECEEDFRRVMGNVPIGRVGDITEGERFLVHRGYQPVIDLSVEEIDRAWKGGYVHDGRENPIGGGEVGREQRHRATSSGLAALELSDPVSHCGATRPRRVALQSVGHMVRSKATILSRPRVMVLAAAGVNCDRETVEACRLAGAEPQLVHLNQLISREARLRDFGMLVFPGGFSYGDHLGAGAMLASVLRRHLLGEIEEMVADGRPVLGICNGFQVIARLGLLGPVSLVGNSSGRFECRWTRLRIEPSRCIFLRDLEELELPIAHGEGRVVPRAGGAVPELAAHAPLRYVENPNGSVLDIAGVCNAAGNVLGLMPHPERFVTLYQHPRRDGAEAPAGLRIFENAVRYLKEGL